MYFKAIAFYCSFVIFVNEVSCNVFISSVTLSSSKFVKCSNVCETTFSRASYKIARSECCNRGCRFYKIADMVGATKQLELNYSKGACHNSCFESYSEEIDRAACNLGCNVMASQKLMHSFSAAQFVWSYLMKNRAMTLDDQTGEMMEPEDLLIDPGLRTQLISDSVERNKLPLVHKKTLPMNREEFEKWWADCTLKYVEFPRCISSIILTFIIFFALYHTFCGSRYVEPTQVPANKFSDEAFPLPPKYSFIKEDIKV